MAKSLHMEQQLNLCVNYRRKICSEFNVFQQFFFIYDEMVLAQQLILACVCIARQLHSQTKTHTLRQGSQTQMSDGPNDELIK